MPVLSKMSAEEKAQYCQNVYEQHIVRTWEFLESCDQIANILRVYIPSGCYTNFRDMLFHFHRMTNTNEESIIFSQVASIMEHAHRAMRDAEVALSVRCVTVFNVLKSRYTLCADTIDAMECQIACLQNCVLRMRLGNMMLEGMDVLSPSDEEFFDMIEEYFSCAETYAEKEFKEVIAYSQELKERFCKVLKDIFNSEEENDFMNFRAFSTYNDIADLVYESLSDT